MKSNVSIASVSIADTFSLGVLIAGGRLCGGVAGVVGLMDDLEDALRLLKPRAYEGDG